MNSLTQRMIPRIKSIAMIACAAILISGCTRDIDATSNAEGHADAAAAPTNRISIPAAVRQNLDITFVTVEPRHVAQTLRVPGRFEYVPTARREYRTMLPGRVEMVVEQYDAVAAGAPLYSVDSPAWRDMQGQLADAEATIQRLTARLASYGPLIDAHHNHERQLERSVKIRRERVVQLKSVAAAGGGRRADLIAAQGEAIRAEADLAEVLEKDAELHANESESRVGLSAAIAKREFLLESTAAILRMPVEQLSEVIDDGSARWRSISTIMVHAEDAGVVESLGLTNGAWADQESAVLTVVQPNRLRFHAVGLQSDLGRLRDGLTATIVAPSPTRVTGAIDLAETMPGILQLGLSGDPVERTIDLYVVPESLASWARHGVSAQLEIVTNSTASPALAIPSAAIQHDGLRPILFRRDPGNPDLAIRVEADLGIDDGRWVVVHSGLRTGDQVVLDGSFQLMLATATGGNQDQGGHFHADGTFHDADH